MSSQSNNLSKGDIISFVALLILGVTIFFGMNFKTLGDKVPSAVVAVLIVGLMVLFVFLAAYAKKQNRNQDNWKKIEYVMLALYVLALIPSYIYSSKFFDIQFKKTEITQKVQNDIDGINKLFTDYNKKCESRSGGFQTALESMSQDQYGLQKIADMLDIDVANVSPSSIKQASESFLKTLKGNEYKALETNKKTLVSKVQTNFKNWNLMFIPQYASELGMAKERYATELKNIYDKHNNQFETNVPNFDPQEYLSKGSVANAFTDTTGLSVVGLIAVLILGGLGLVKYLLGERRTVKELKMGEADDTIEIRL